MPLKIIKSSDRDRQVFRVSNNNQSELSSIHPKEDSIKMNDIKNREDIHVNIVIDIKCDNEEKNIIPHVEIRGINDGKTTVSSADAPGQASLAQRLIDDTLIKSKLDSDSNYDIHSQDESQKKMNYMLLLEKNFNRLKLPRSQETSPAIPPQPVKVDTKYHNKSRVVSLSDEDDPKKNISSEIVEKRENGTSETPKQETKILEASKVESPKIESKVPKSELPKKAFQVEKEIIKEAIREVRELPEAGPKLNEEISTIFLSADTQIEGAFYVASDQASLSRLTEMITDRVAKIESAHVPKHIRVGDSVLAKAEDDNCWYRAIVTELDQEKKFVTVRYFDYGNEQSLNRDRIRRNNFEELSTKSVPSLAIRVVLDPRQTDYDKIKSHIFNDEPALNLCIDSYDSKTSTYTVTYLT